MIHDNNKTLDREGLGKRLKKSLGMTLDREGMSKR